MFWVKRPLFVAGEVMSWRTRESMFRETEVRLVALGQLALTVVLSTFCTEISSNGGQHSFRRSSRDAHYLSRFSVNVDGSSSAVFLTTWMLLSDRLFRDSLADFWVDFVLFYFAYVVRSMTYNTQEHQRIDLILYSGACNCKFAIWCN